MGIQNKLQVGYYYRIIFFLFKLMTLFFINGHKLVVCICVRTATCEYVNVCKCAWVCMSQQACGWVQAWVCNSVFVYVRLWVCENLSICVCMCEDCLYAWVYTCAWLCKVHAFLCICVTCMWYCVCASVHVWDFLV